MACEEPRSLGGTGPLGTSCRRIIALPSLIPGLFENHVLGPFDRLRVSGECSELKPLVVSLSNHH